MAKKPAAPRIKKQLPKQKKRQSHNVHEQTKEAIRDVLKKNFGILGVAVAKKYVPNTPKTVKANNSDPKINAKNIKSKPISKNTAAIDAILLSGNTVTAAVMTVADNVTRSFAMATKEAKNMGEQISLGLRSLNTTLDKFLFKNKSTPTSSSGTPSSGVTPTPKEQDQDNTKSSSSSVLDLIGSKRSAKGFRAKGFKSRAFRTLGRLGTILSILSQGSEAIDEYQETGNAGRAASGFAGGVAGTSGGGAGGAALGALIGSIFPGPGTAIGGFVGGMVGAYGGGYAGQKAGHSIYDTLTTKSDKKIEIGTKTTAIQKMKYEAKKIKFSANEYIMFSSKNNVSYSTHGTSQQTSQPSVTTTPSTSPSTSLGSSSQGGSSLADIIHRRATQNSSQAKPSNTEAPETPDVDYNGPDKGQYDSRKARANFAQPGKEFGEPGKNNTTITTQGGHTFEINKASAEPFQRTIEAFEKANAPIGSISGYSPRPGGIKGTGRMSQHTMGNAMDIGSQTDRDTVSPEFRKWAETHPKEFRKILDENGMISGGDWSDPDLGHIEWSGRKPWLEKKERETNNTPDKKEDATPLSKADPSFTPQLTNDMSEFWGSGDTVYQPKWAKYANKKWNWMRHNTADIEDRRYKDTTQAPNRYDADEIKKEGEKEYEKTWDELNKPSALSEALGGKDLDMQRVTNDDLEFQQKRNALNAWREFDAKNKLSPPDEITTSSIAPNSIDKSVNKQSHRTFFDINDDDDELDHRPKQEAAPQQKYDDYMSTTSGMEDE